jgi:CheY-like chemotaxis protein
MPVDDDHIIASTLAVIFNMNGYSARCFTRLEVLTAGQSDIPDLLVSDLAMPELSGIDLAIQMRAEHPECKILLLSAHATAQDLLEILVTISGCSSGRFIPRSFSMKSEQCDLLRFESEENQSNRYPFGRRIPVLTPPISPFLGPQ